MIDNLFEKERQPKKATQYPQSKKVSPQDCHSRRAFLFSNCRILDPIVIGTIVPGNIVPGVFAISSMDLKKTMATNVRRTRQARKITQEELADRAGLSARYLGSIERATVSALPYWDASPRRWTLTLAN